MTGDIKKIGYRLLNRLAAEKKKSFVAISLIVLMLFMWGKLLAGKGPDSAQGAIYQQQTASAQNKDQLGINIEFVDPPFAKGRHDVLKRDFFNVETGVFAANNQVNIVSTNGEAGKIQYIADKLRLEAISMGSQPEAFVNDRLVKVGDILIVSDGSKNYDCEIVRIENMTVFVKCGKAEIELKLKQPDDL